MEVAMEPNGRPWCATASQVTNTLTTNPTQGPATRPAAHTATIRSLSQPACETVTSSTRPRTKKDQQGRSLIAPRQQRTFWPPEARHKCEREGCRYQYANFIENRIHRVLPPK